MLTCKHRHTAATHPHCFENKRPANILLADIETLPMVYESWSTDPRFLNPGQKIKDWSISCWAAKWLFDSEILGQVVTPREARARTEKSTLKGLWDLLDKADIVVYHNGNGFDRPKWNTKFIKAGYPPPSFYAVVDTYQIAKKEFSFTYNRLDELGQEFGIGKKMDMSYPDFSACGRGEQAALDKMITYCKRDVAPLLEDVYLYLLPWIRNHPNMNIYADNDTDVCRNCGGEIHWDGSTYPTAQGLWKGWRCDVCGAIGRGTTKKNRIRSTTTV